MNFDREKRRLLFVDCLDHPPRRQWGTRWGLIHKAGLALAAVLVALFLAAFVWGIYHFLGFVQVEPPKAWSWQTLAERGERR